MYLPRLLLSVAATLLLLSCQTNSSHGLKVDSTLRSYVPRDTTLLAGLDIHDLMEAPFYQRHASQLNSLVLNQMALNQITAKLGIDLRRDVSYVLLPFRNGQPVVLARGTFDRAKAAPHLGAFGIVFPQKNVAVAGPRQFVQAYMAGGARGIPEPLLARIRALPSADQLWIVSSKGLPLNWAPLRPDVASMVSNLAGYVIAFDAGLALDTGAHVQISLRCDSSADAKQVYAALRGGIGLARLTTPDKDLPMLKLYDAIRVASDQDTVELRADLSADLAEQLYVLVQNGAM